MRHSFFPLALFALIAAAPTAHAAVAIEINKDTQQMTVAVDGDVRYRWPVSTGNPSYETPNGSFRTFRMEPDHFSKEFDDAPMPHSIFFTRQGHAIHGTLSEKSLGQPVSHGCVRLSRSNAATLYRLVEEEGLLKTTVTLKGSSTVALARNRKGATTFADRGTPDYDASGQPIGPPQQLTPQYAGRPVYPPRPRGYYSYDDAYYSTDPVDQRRYAAPRGYRYDNNGYAGARRSYTPYPDDNAVYAPSPYPGRGLFSQGW